MHRIARTIQLSLLVVMALLLMAPITSTQQTTQVISYGLELDGVFAGRIKGYEGGTATANIFIENMGPDYIFRKHIGGVKYEDIKLTVGTGMSAGFYKWIKDTLNHASTSGKSGAIIAADYQNRVLWRLEFTRAFIAEVGFPALDGGNPNPAYLTIVLGPELTEFKPTLVGGAPPTMPSPSTTPKQWKASNFRLLIPGLESSASKVRKVEALVVKQEVVRNAVGEQRDSQLMTGKLEVGNLVVSLAETDSQAFYDWHDDFVIKGRNGSSREKSATLEFLTPSNPPQALFTLTLTGLGIFSLKPAGTTDAGGRIMKAEMYVENSAFSASALSTGQY